jgi:hypothetical protein
VALRTLRAPGSSTCNVFVVCAVALAFYIVLIIRTSTRIGHETFYTLFDDEMISMRYARNLAGGHGLVWNPGEPPVEGYTNPLWTLWMAVVHMLPLPESKVSLAVMLSCAALLLSNVWVVARIAALLSGDSRFVVTVSAALTAFYFGIIYWTLRGTEIGLLTLLIDTSLLLALRAPPSRVGCDVAALSVLLGAAVLVRPDAIVAGAVVLLVAVLRAPRPGRLLHGAILAGALLGAFAANTLFRIGYYGDLLPNTYYLKLTGTPLAVRIGRGFSTFVHLVRSHLWVPALFGCAAFRSLPRAEGRGAPGRELLPLAALVLVQCAYSVYVGGDAWEWMPFANRYIAIAMPSLIILASVGCRTSASAILGRPEGAHRERALRWAWALTGILLVAAGSYYWARLGQQPRPGGAYEALRNLGIALLLLVGAGTLLSVRAGPRWLDRRLQGFTARELESGTLRSLAIGAVLFFMIWLPLSGPAFKDWFFHNAIEAPLDAAQVRLGLLIRETTQENARVAVERAGTIPYFSHRACIDLLGKNDPIIAKQRAVRSKFQPGHTKWNLAHSVEDLRPDLVVHGTPDPDAPAFLEKAGYEVLGEELWVRGDSRLVDRERLGAGWSWPWARAPWSVTPRGD